jgi:hypothetical protein
MEMRGGPATLNRLAIVHVVFYPAQVSAFDPFVLKMALRKALKLISGLRRQVTDIDESIMTKKIVEELEISGWEITRKPGRNAGLRLISPSAGQRSSRIAVYLLLLGLPCRDWHA